MGFPALESSHTCNSVRRCLLIVSCAVAVAVPARSLPGVEASDALRTQDTHESHGGPRVVSGLHLLLRTVRAEHSRCGCTAETKRPCSWAQHDGRQPRSDIVGGHANETRQRFPRHGRKHVLHCPVAEPLLLRQLPTQAMTSRDPRAGNAMHTAFTAS